MKEQKEKRQIHKVMMDDTKRLKEVKEQRNKNNLKIEQLGKENDVRLIIMQNKKEATRQLLEQK